MRNSKELIELVNLIGKNKSTKNTKKLFALAVLAGMYIAFGAIFFTTVTSYGGHPGAIKILGGIAFSLGLILVVLAGAELFTGNNLMVVSYLNKKIRLQDLFKNWLIVYIGNFLGSLILVYLMFATKQYLQEDGTIGRHALFIANSKVNLDFTSAFSRAILCNILVCLAVWLTMVAKTFTGKVLAIIFPISAFVAIGYEHSVANMFFIPMGLLIKKMAPTSFWQNNTINEYANLDINHFLFNNLIPVTLGNIVGGVVFVAAIYWFIHREEDE
jgi:formate transporter FocA